MGEPTAHSSLPARPDPSSADAAALLSIIESASDGIITVDETHRVVLFNQGAEKLFGVPAAEAVGSSLDRFIPERYRRTHSEHMRAFASTGVTVRQMGRLGTLSGLRANGTEFPIEASISQTVVDGRRLLTVILRDISERRRLEEQLLHAQKMEGIGRLTSGISHDFNNLLMAIFNFLTLATNRLEPLHPARAHLAQAQEAAGRAAQLTRQLLTFARKQAAKPRVVSPVEIVLGMEPMLRRVIGDDVVLRIIAPPDTGNVRADPAQLEQVIMNLVVNARDAMPTGGSVTIECADVVLDEPPGGAASGTLPGPHVGIAVRDTGVGMSPDVLAHLFEPFFTTKEPGKGTGLGLSVCHGIVHQAGGHIAVQSAPGRGTTIQVLIPRVTEAPAAQSGHALPAPPRGTETVLLVEDSAMLRGLLADALREAGYTVLVAMDGNHALYLVNTHAGPIDMLITDVMMPGLSGPRLAQVLGQMRSRLPVLFISGGHDEIVVDRGTGPERAALLTKPFTTDMLLRKIRAVLDATGEH